MESFSFQYKNQIVKLDYLITSTSCRLNVKENKIYNNIKKRADWSAAFGFGRNILFATINKLNI